MRGLVPVISFAVLGGLSLVGGNYLATHGVWCGEHATPGCNWTLVHDDISFAVSMFGFGVVALVAVALIGSLLLRLARDRRPAI